MSGALELALALEDGERWEELVDLCLKVLSGERSDQPSWQYRLGRAHYKCKNWHDAEDAFSTAINSPDAAPAWFHHHGLALERLHRWRDACKSYRQALALDENRGHTWHRLGRVLHRRRNFIGAVQAHARALEVRGSRPEYWLSLALSLEGAGSHSAAATAYGEYEQKRRRADGAGRISEPLPLETRIQYSLGPKPAYAYALHRTAQLAIRLGIERFTAIELGVAGGRGLLALEAHAEEISRLHDVDIKIVGLDTGQGLPAPTDFRDLPFYFKEGDYPMEEESLRHRLTSASLLLGDAAQSVEKAMDTSAPIGVLLFDMDLYSSTQRVLSKFGDSAIEEAYLPRISVYFDDIVPKRRTEFLKDYSSITGEAAAIADYNSSNSHVALCPDLYFETAAVRAPWHACMHLMHRTSHPQYGINVGAANPTGLSLE